MKIILRRPDVEGRIARCNLSCLEAAALCGLGSGHFSQLLRGERHPSPRVRKQLLRGFSEAFGESVTFDEVFAFVEAEGLDAPKAPKKTRYRDGDESQLQSLRDAVAMPLSSNQEQATNEPI